MIIACSFHIQKIFTNTSASIVLYSQPIDIVGYDHKIQIRAKLKVILNHDSDHETVYTGTSVGMELSIEEVDIVVVPVPYFCTATGLAGASAHQLMTKFNYCVQVNVKYSMGSSVDTYWTTHVQ